MRVVGIDDWSWRKGSSYGTIIVDLERREVVDVLSDRSAEATARWLSQHTKVEIVSRDRYGLYAEGTRRGAPQARQVADRFHLVQNLRKSPARGSAQSSVRLASIGALSRSGRGSANSQSETSWLRSRPRRATFGTISRGARRRDAARAGICCRRSNV
ncbi:MAG: ISL3 family transposase [Methylocella sp.]